MLSCVCVVREAGIARVAIEELDELRRFRDVEMVKKRRGQRWVFAARGACDELPVLQAGNKPL
jgi:hypothetical protein